ncbi:liver-enriched gene 1, tandem duplicate 1 [Epinephelus lanceolatus]|uniref:protein LEG1 homolog n=1 Tax=Epinephelus lanceolatus TaxID=310571 RepID=UPI001444A6D1|nr:protein LEG1 homolog [Epinephelus lanceolatus]
MMCAAFLGLLLACAVSLSSSAPVLDNGMPLMWSQTVDQVSALPKQNDVVTPDPWTFVNRMSLYRLLIAATDPYMGCMGTNATDSPVWGLPLQLAWMKTSGRLADPTGATTCGLETGDASCISPQSWWSCVNYFVSALPFLSAAQQGLMGADVQVTMQVPEGVEGYCTTYTECAASYPDAMTKWDAFFQALKGANENPQPDDEKKDTLLGLYWDAQMASTYASAACKAKQSHLSSVEVSFANSWLNSAEYVSAAHFQSGLTKSAMFMAPLPSRVLKVGDNAPNIADMTKEENHTLSTFSWMNYINNLLAGSLVSSWKRAMCSVDTRAKGREMLEQLLLNPSYATSTFVSIVTGMSGC